MPLRLALACQRPTAFAGYDVHHGELPFRRLHADGVVRPRARRAWWGHGPGLGPGSAPVLQPAGDRSARQLAAGGRSARELDLPRFGLARRRLWTFTGERAEAEQVAVPAPEQVELHQNAAQVMQRDSLQQQQRGGGCNVEGQELDSARLDSVQSFTGGPGAWA